MRGLGCVVSVAALTLVSSAFVLGAGTTDVKLKVERVALFKNGLGYFTAGAALPGDATSVRFGQLPIPSLGTFWVGCGKNVAVRGLYTSLEDATEERAAQNVAEFLSANVGRKMTLYTSAKESAVVTGTLIAVNRPAPPEPLSPYVMEAPQPERNRFRGFSPGGRLVIVRADTGTVTVNAGYIVRADIQGGDAKTSCSVPLKRPSLRMELERPAGGERVAVSYLAHGVTWSPSYHIDLSDPKSARLSAKALVINETADWDGVKLELVTGFPNLTFADVNSPIAKSESLANFLNALERGRTEGRRGRGGVMAQQAAIMDNVAYFADELRAPDVGYAAARAGRTAEDLFLYPVDNFTLRRNETALVPLFTAEASYKHVYIWKIPDLITDENRHQSRQERSDRPPQEEVWHSCRLKNAMKMPWTTAPAQFVKDGQIIGQDICYYTAPGTETTVRINRAMNVLAQQAEMEESRERGVVTYYGYRYDRVKVKGELRVRSRLKKPADIEITKELSGDVTETSPQAQDTPLAKGLKEMNVRHKLLWKITLKPGEEKKLTYAYQVLVRR